MSGHDFPIHEFVAPYQSCLLCYRGDTTTGFAIVGTPHAAAAGLHALLGLDLQEAIGTVTVCVEESGGSFDSEEEEPHVFRVCPSCAAKHGQEVKDIYSPDGIPAIKINKPDQG